MLSPCTMRRFATHCTRAPSPKFPTAGSSGIPRTALMRLVCPRPEVFRSLRDVHRWISRVLRDGHLRVGGPARHVGCFFLCTLRRFLCGLCLLGCLEGVTKPGRL